MSRKRPAAAAPLLSAIGDALQLIERHGGPRREIVGTVAPLPSLLDQCRALHVQNIAEAVPSIRTVHHFACTGGSLITKCIAAMPNTLVLSEIDPLSRIGVDPEAPQFAPSDLVRHMQYSRRPIRDADLAEVFLAGLTTLQTQCRSIGRRLVLRDHAHSHYCFGPEVPTRPALDEIIARNHPVRALVTLRHPLDSFLSLRNLGWMHFTPGTLDEYARRYHAFLDHHDGRDWIRYEDFVRHPEAVMEEICNVLHLPYDPSFMALLSALPITGDSGRSGDTIAARPRRAVPEALETEARDSAAFGNLLDRMGYRWEGMA